MVVVVDKIEVNCRRVLVDAVEFTPNLVDNLVVLIAVELDIIFVVTFGVLLDEVDVEIKLELIKDKIEVDGLRVLVDVVGAKVWAEIFGKNNVDTLVELVDDVRVEMIGDENEVKGLRVLVDAVEVELEA